MTEQQIRELWREIALTKGDRIGVSPNQLGLMNGLLGNALKPLVGKDSNILRDARLQFLRRVTDLPLSSSKQLTFAWVSTIIDQLICKDEKGNSLYPYELSRRGKHEVSTIWREIQKERGQLELAL